MKDNKTTPIVNSDRYELECLNGLNKLTIRKAHQEDSGHYTCILDYPALNIDPIELNYELHFDGENIIGKDSLKTKRDSSLMKLKTEISNAATNYYRDFKRKPIFSTLLADRTAAEGSTVRLTATAIGVDCHSVWMKNNRPIESGAKYKTSFNTESGMAILEIHDVQVDDGGDYSCTVGNSFGENETSARLKVYEGFEKSPMPATFTRTIRGNTIFMHFSLFLTIYHFNLHCTTLSPIHFCTPFVFIGVSFYNIIHIN